MEKTDLIKELREYYLENLPAGFSKGEIKTMEVEDLLDMHYFLNEEEEEILEENDGIDFDPDILCESCRAKLIEIMEKAKIKGR